MEKWEENLEETKFICLVPIKLVVKTLIFPVVQSRPKGEHNAAPEV